MNRMAMILCGALALIPAGRYLAGAEAAQQSPVAKTHLKVSEMAPDFTLQDQNRQSVKLSDFRGKKNVVVAFYVLAFTGG